MPFIAIALAISVFLGGSAAVATTPLGHAAVDHVASVWSSIEADYSNELGIEEKADAEASSETTVEANTEASTKVEAETALKINLF